jgi:hypothetical protein
MRLSIVKLTDGTLGLGRGTWPKPNIHDAPYHVGLRSPSGCDPRPTNKLRAPVSSEGPNPRRTCALSASRCQERGGCLEAAAVSPGSQAGGTLVSLIL